jgi:hypothetical protein
MKKGQVPTDPSPSSLLPSYRANSCGALVQLGTVLTV